MPPTGEPPGPCRPADHTSMWRTGKNPPGKVILGALFLFLDLNPPCYSRKQFSRVKR